MKTQDPPLLEITDLKTTFRSRGCVTTAVKGLSLELRAGQTLGLVGESGSGKSVTSLSIMRLLPAMVASIEPGSRIAFMQRELVELSQAQMRAIRGKDISMIFQEPMSSLNPVFSTGDQVIEAIMLHQGVDYESARVRAIELFEEVGIPEAARRIDTFPHEMSGGQKQRVMIAMALSCNPKLLIADEPTTALDVTIQAQILQLMKRLCKERDMAILFITHDLGVIAEIADEVAVMYRGEVVERGDVETIFAAPKHPYTRGLLACRPRLDTVFRRLPTVRDFMRESVDEEGVTSHEAMELGSERLDALTRAGRARLLHPKSVLEGLGFEVEDQASEVATHIAEGEEPLLRVSDLRVFFSTRRGLLGGRSEPVRAVDGLSFDVYRGQTLGLVGESGCGKTTAGRAILRLIEPSGGEVFFDGRDLAGLNSAALREARKRMQIIFQDPYSALNPRKSVEAILTDPMKVHGLGADAAGRRQLAADLLEEVGLSEPGVLRRFPHEFSGGQRQRVCIARALALSPDFIICDESVSALDVSVQAQVLNLLKDLQERRGLTYLFISHDLSVVKFMSDMMAVMNEGKFVEFGPSDAIYADPKQDYTRRLIEAIPRDGLEAIRARRGKN